MAYQGFVGDRRLPLNRVRAAEPLAVRRPGNGHIAPAEEFLRVLDPSLCVPAVYQSLGLHQAGQRGASVRLMRAAEQQVRADVSVHAMAGQQPVEFGQPPAQCRAGEGGTRRRGRRCRHRHGCRRGGKRRRRAEKQRQEHCADRHGIHHFVSSGRSSETGSGGFTEDVGNPARRSISLCRANRCGWSRNRSRESAAKNASDGGTSVSGG